MLTQTVEYALRIAVCLAESDPRPQTADDLARATRVPRAYLAKVVQSMVRGGTARSKRGVGGGVALAKSPANLTLLDVINSVEPIKRMGCHSVVGEGRSAGLGCLNRRFEKGLVAVEHVFAESTLAEIVSDAAKATPAGGGKESQAETGSGDRDGRSMVGAATLNGHAMGRSAIPQSFADPYRKALAATNGVSEAH